MTHLIYWRQDEHNNLMLWSRCSFCPKFKTLIQLSGHEKSHTKPYLCMLCNWPFSSLYAVRKHMTSHEEGINGKTPLKFQCDMCGPSYACSFALKDHLKIHAHNIPPAPGCKTSLMNHQVTYHELVSILLND